jgi:predicted nucleic acid-binding protein
MCEKNNSIQILIDADVIIHFIDGGRLNDLPAIFPNRIVFVDKVLEELYSFRQYKVQVFNFIAQNNFDKIELDSNIEFISEYAKLIKFAGKGEAACMAIAKIEKKYIASSNLKDIKEYCYKNGIEIITTMDFLCEALNCKVLTEEECDKFIQDVKQAGNKLPVNSIAEYVKFYKM